MNRVVPMFVWCFTNKERYQKCNKKGLCHLPLIQFDCPLAFVQTMNWEEATNQKQKDEKKNLLAGCYKKRMIDFPVNELQEKNGQSPPINFSETSINEPKGDADVVALKQKYKVGDFF